MFIPSFTSLFNIVSTSWTEKKLIRSKYSFFSVYFYCLLPLILHLLWLFITFFSFIMTARHHSLPLIFCLLLHFITIDSKFIIAIHSHLFPIYCHLLSLIPHLLLPFISTDSPFIAINSPFIIAIHSPFTAIPLWQARQRWRRRLEVGADDTRPPSLSCRGDCHPPSPPEHLPTGPDSYFRSRESR